MDIRELCKPYTVSKEDEELLNKHRVNIVLDMLKTMPEGLSVSADRLAITLAETMPHTVSVHGWYESIRDCFRGRYVQKTKGFRRTKDANGKLVIIRLATKQGEEENGLSKVA